MLIDHDSHPNESLIYIMAEIIEYINNDNKNINNIVDFFAQKNINYNLIYLSLDALFLLNYIKDINDKGELVRWY